MKIVIDIPEIAYEAYKEWHKNKVATVEQSLIAQGTPYEERPQGRWLPFNYDDEFVENVRDTVWDEVYAPRFKCSECGCDDFASTYCPNCGALMEDSEDNENE